MRSKPSKIVTVAMLTCLILFALVSLFSFALVFELGVSFEIRHKYLYAAVHSNEGAKRIIVKLEDRANLVNWRLAELNKISKPFWVSCYRREGIHWSEWSHFDLSVARFPIDVKRTSPPIIELVAEIPDVATFLIFSAVVIYRNIAIRRRPSTPV